MRRNARGWESLLVGLVWVIVGTGCGEKITIPEAVGIPLITDYVEQIPWSLTDPVDVVEAFGRIYVLEQSPGTLTKYTTQQEQKAQAPGLVSPVALALDSGDRRVLAAEWDGTVAAISMFDIANLDFLGRADISAHVASIAAIASDGTWLYVSDPDSGAVHRFAWSSEAEDWLVPRGLVTADVTVGGGSPSIESVNFVFHPQGLGLTPGGRLFICDADTLRSWVLHFDPLPPPDTPDGRGTAELLRGISCPTQPPAAYVLGRAPGCGEEFESGSGAEPGSLRAPMGVTFDERGRIYVADTENGRVQRFEPDGRFDLALGSALEGLEGVDGLERPTRLATWLGTDPRDPKNIQFPGARVYVVDRGRSQIRIFEDSVFSDFQRDR